MGVSEKTVLISGENCDIGRSIARNVAHNGGSAMLLSPAADPDESAESEDVDNIVEYSVDLSEPEVVKFVARRLRSAVGTPDILINLTANSTQRTFRETTPREAQEYIQTHYLSPYFLIWELLDELDQTGEGQIINIVPARTQAGGAPTNATHDAIRGLTTSLHAELAPTTITSSLIVCGTIEGTHQETQGGNTYARTISPNQLADCVMKVIESKTDRAFVPPELRFTRRLPRIPPTQDN